MMIKQDKGKFRASILSKVDNTSEFPRKNSRFQRTQTVAKTTLK